MAAVVAALHVAAECRGAAALDREHGAPPRGGQRRAMLITESLAEAAEHVRHFRPLAGHGSRASGGHVVRRGWRNSVERFKWAEGGAQPPCSTDRVIGTTAIAASIGEWAACARMMFVWWCGSHCGDITPPPLADRGTRSGAVCRRRVTVRRMHGRGQTSCRRSRATASRPAARGCGNGRRSAQPVIVTVKRRSSRFGDVPT